MKGRRRSRSRKRAATSENTDADNPQYNNWTVKALKDKLAELGLPTKGKKADLVKTLAAHNTTDDMIKTESTGNKRNSWWVYMSKLEFIVNVKSNFVELFHDMYYFIRCVFLFICWNIVAYQMVDTAICQKQQVDHCTFDTDNKPVRERFCCTSAIGSTRQTVRTLFILITAIPYANKRRGYQGAFICMYAYLLLYDLEGPNVFVDVLVMYLFFLCFWYCVIPQFQACIGQCIIMWFILIFLILVFLAFAVVITGVINNNEKLKQ